MLHARSMLRAVLSLTLMFATAACGVVADIGDLLDPTEVVPSESRPPSSLGPVSPDAGLSPGEWQLENPRPIATHLFGLWGTEENRVWLAGQGAIFRYDGVNVTRSLTRPADEFHDVWASADDDVWAIGSRGVAGVTVHFDGKTWADDPSLGDRSIHAIHGFSRNDVWVASGDELLRRDAAGWKAAFRTSNGRTIRALWGTRSDDLWAVGDEGLVVHWDGASATPMSWWSSAGDAKAWIDTIDLFGVWGASASDVWIVGSFNRGRPDNYGETILAHWDGSKWGTPVFQRMCATGPLVGNDPKKPELRGRAIWGEKASPHNARSRVVVVRQGCRVVRMDDASGQEPTWQWSVASEDMRGVGGAPSWPLLAVGRAGRVQTFENGVGPRPVFPGVRSNLHGPSIGEDGEAWAVSGSFTADPYVATRWSNGWVPVRGLSPGKSVSAVGVHRANDVWVGSTVVVPGPNATVKTESWLDHWNGVSWDAATKLAGIERIERIRLDPTGVPWVVGWPSAVLRRDGEGFTRIPLAHDRATVTDVVPLGRDSAWISAVGPSNSGFVARYDGTEMRSVLDRPAQDGSMWSIDATSDEDVWVASDPPLHWDGTTWSTVAAPAALAVWSRGPDEVYFLSPYRSSDPSYQENIGRLMRWGGGRVETIESEVPMMVGIAGRQNTAIAVGDEGVTFRFRLRGESPTR